MNFEYVFDKSGDPFVNLTYDVYISTWDENGI